MKRNRSDKPYWEMTAEELAEATKEFDKEIPPSKIRPLSEKERRWLKGAQRGGFQSIRLKKGTRALTKQERAEFERMRRSPHRSVFVTRGTDGTFIRLESDLMRWCSRYAVEHKMTFSEVVAKSLQGMMAMVG